jgi:alpha-N-arabinofuranosidase
MIEKAQYGPMVNNSNGKFRFKVIPLLLAELILASSLHAQPSADYTATIAVQVDKPGVAISPTLYGLMTEEINYSYDGGLYAELVRNRSLQDDPEKPVYWSLVNNGGAEAAITLDRANPLPGNPLSTSLRLDIKNSDSKERVGVANDGYWGIPVRSGMAYQASFFARTSPDFTEPVTVSLETSDGQKTWAEADVSGLGQQWKKYEVTLTVPPGVPSTLDNRLVISARSKGTIWLTLVSLFPPTYAQRPNGLRPDLMEKLSALEPAFLRFPGGNYLEGNSFDTRFDWKKTLGPLESRPGHMGCWGYRSTDGMGLMEFLLWCEDLKMEPVLGVFAGYSLKGEVVSTPEGLKPFVDDALEEIEFVTGDIHTPWGRKRAELGHPEPFKLRYVEVGNEDTFDKSKSYDVRYAAFYDAIKAKYPQLQLIATTKVNGRIPDLLDEHFYRSAKEMQRDAGHYDKLDRKGPKIFVGEWATREGAPTPNLNAALGDAAWLTGLERNSDLVVMSAYAPLLTNVSKGAMQWSPDLIGYNGLVSFGSPSYWAQVMFAQNKGDVVLPATVQCSSKIASVPPKTSGAVGVGSWGTQVELKDLEWAQDGAITKFPLDSGLKDWQQLLGGGWAVQNDTLVQPLADEKSRRIVTTSTNWSDGDFHFKARKTGGTEGFQVFLRYNGQMDHIILNLGANNNTKSSLTSITDGERTTLWQSKDLTIDANRWYDVSLAIQGTKVSATLDGKPLCEATLSAREPLEPMYVSASQDLKTKEIILKVVNVGDVPLSTNIQLDGVQQLLPQAKVLTLSGPDRLEQNSVEQPEKLRPVESVFKVSGPDFIFNFPARSISVLRLGTLSTSSNGN